jgi:uncharacterized protein (DUF849 family)
MRSRGVLVKACLNGGRTQQEHEAVPVSPEDVGADARRAVAAGAGALHMHPRAADGSETLEATACRATIDAVRATCPGVPLGLTTGAWIEPDTELRLAAIEGWEVVPDFASVNVSEEGARPLCDLLRRRGVAVEAGVWSVADARSLLDEGIADRCQRVLVEPQQLDPAGAVEEARAIGDLLDQEGPPIRQLHHGYGIATWAVLEAALSRGHDIRIGLEDTLELPDGRRANGNAELVAEAVRLAGGRGAPRP